MDIITLTRELGVAIQSDDRYTFFRDVKAAMDNDEALQQKIGDFNIARMNLDNELTKDEKDEATLKELNNKIKSLYGEIMSDNNMKKYDDAKNALGGLITQINTIIDAAVNGEDPMTCDLTNCTHDCSTCAGCA
jgi:cell fate (sporulation/competence/biofilm development) regulator YlbF (YheA/YmcA/DUF963 family)